ncbi:cupin domain-containing protein [Nonomuraea turcica]|uniref:hypothetical protein n=1 Tax=Nonomuraea sp. G32 TaxID=3067274 RepID=UPI00273B0927|nr:hypothetical protein [Nonomuraea sp. G32]MDP4505297.1 hypothetical protein [Nonomuraea sp. G32]
MTVVEHTAPDSAGVIPLPARGKEVLKVNVFERGMSLNTQLAPMFPYTGPGDLVPCGCLLRGRPGEEYGQFWHENSQEEVAYAFGSNLAMLPTGSLVVTPKIHGVNSFLEERHNPDAFLFLVIVQRQSDADANPEDQYEAIHLRCEECHELLLRHVFSADPTRPQDDGSDKDDRYPSFATVHGAVAATEKFNNDEELRTCGTCGHLNAPFPAATWGWQHYLTQSRLVNVARSTALATAGDKLSPEGITE